MKKSELNQRLTDHKAVTRNALQTDWDATNKGQRQKLLKNAEIKTILDRYGVNYEE